MLYWREAADPVLGSFLAFPSSPDLCCGGSHDDYYHWAWSSLNVMMSRFWSSSDSHLFIMTLPLPEGLVLYWPLNSRYKTNIKIEGRMMITTTIMMTMTLPCRISSSHPPTRTCWQTSTTTHHRGGRFWSDDDFWWLWWWLWLWWGWLWLW